MTNEEMIKWAEVPGYPGDINAVAHNEALKRLIWIARLQGRQDAFEQVAAFANQLNDASALSSYPRLTKHED